MLDGELAQMAKEIEVRVTDALTTAYAQGVREGMERAAKMAGERKYQVNTLSRDPEVFIKLDSWNEACDDIVAAIRAHAQEGETT